MARSKKLRAGEDPLVAVPDVEIEFDLLFVYGSLRKGGALHPYLQGLGAALVDEGVVGGVLFDLGAFPGAQKSVLEKEILQGEVYKLRNPSRALRILDEVEGYRPHAPSASLFLRENVEVRLRNGEKIQAWIYWLNRWMGPTRRVPSGDYAQLRAEEALVK